MALSQSALNELLEGDAIAGRLRLVGQTSGVGLGTSTEYPSGPRRACRRPRA